MHYTELPKEGFDKCIICGKKTKGTAFCKDCWKEYEKEELLEILNNKDNSIKEESKCIICGETRLTKYLCKECFKEVNENINSLDKNKTIHESRTHYYHLKDNINRLYNSLEHVMAHCNRLIAIALNNKKNNNDSALLDRVYNDVKEIIENKKMYFKKQEEKSTNIDNKIVENIEQRTSSCYAQDGHVLDSDTEVIIDDILYTSEIFHCCHKPVTDIIEANKICDWFIPIDSINKGIYIEYWGYKDTQKRIKERKEKEKLYKKHNIPYISIERDEPKIDRQTFTANLIKEINAVAKQYFGAMPKWKK